MPPPEAPPAEVAPPSFLTSADEAPREPRRWIGWVAAAFGVILAVGGFATRDRWLPLAQAQLRPAPAEGIALNTRDAQGELQIRWNGAAPLVRSASGGSLLILDGAATVSVPLDASHMQSGAFTYRRRSDRVDVTLALTQAEGKEVRVATLFTGDPPPRPAAAPELSPQHDSVLQQELQSAEAANAALKAGLAKQIERNRLLEKAIEDLRKAVRREQQRKRLEVQSPDAGK